VKDLLKERSRRAVVENAERLISLSHRIHEHPETAWHEINAASWITDELRRSNFIVNEIADLPTAFIASIGSGDLHIAICAEYDALPGVGHACGHNIIAAAAVGAGIGLANLANEIGARVSIVGTPAEEGAGGKIYMLERGVFDDVDAAMMIHPAPVNVARADPFSVSHFRVTFTGKAAHAATYPDEGINAADAFIVAEVAIGLLRQQLPANARVHGVVTKAGDAPNVIADLSEGRWYVRGATLKDLDAIESRVRACFEAGALATGCMLRIEPEGPRYSEFKNDEAMLALFVANSNVLGRIFEPSSPQSQMNRASTDMGNVSLVVPSIHPYLGIDSLPATNHQREFADHCVSESADAAVLDGAIAMAWTAIDMATTHSIRVRLIKLGDSNLKS
jgi:amidohydrolase